MNNFNDIELNVLGCILVKPDLMKELDIEDGYFVKHQRTWQFIKSCYKKFGTLDIQLMFSICSNKYHLCEYLEQVMDVNFDYWNFDKYKKRLIEQYFETEKEKWIKNKVFQLANDFYVGNINFKQWNKKLNEIYDNANTIFENESEGEIK